MSLDFTRHKRRLAALPRVGDVAHHAARRRKVLIVAATIALAILVVLLG